VHRTMILLFTTSYLVRAILGEVAAQLASVAVRGCMQGGEGSQGSAPASPLRWLERWEWISELLSLRVSSASSRSPDKSNVLGSNFSRRLIVRRLRVAARLFTAVPLGEGAGGGCAAAVLLPHWCASSDAVRGEPLCALMDRPVVISLATQMLGGDSVGCEAACRGRKATLIAGHCRGMPIASVAYLGSCGLVPAAFFLLLD
jgi:hypothetical protein